MGTAKFIAITSEIEMEREKIYEEGAVWQNIIMNLSKSKINEEIENRQTFLALILYIRKFNSIKNNISKWKNYSY